MTNDSSSMFRRSIEILFGSATGLEEKYDHKLFIVGVPRKFANLVRI